MCNRFNSYVDVGEVKGAWTKCFFVMHVREKFVANVNAVFWSLIDFATRGKIYDTKIYDANRHVCRIICVLSDIGV